MPDSSPRAPLSVLACCIGHKPVEFSPPLEFTMVCPVPMGAPSEMIVPEDRFGSSFHGTILSEYTQLFGLAEHLNRLSAPPAALYLFQYRKFAATRAGSRTAADVPHAFAATPDEAAALFPRTEELESLSGRVLTGTALRLKRSIAHHYSMYHLVEDFAAFVAACSVTEGFGQDRVARFINSPILFPAPSLCLIPTRLFGAMMGELMRVWQNFARHHLRERSGYQRRVGGFLLERLHSFLLLEHISSLPAGQTSVGHQIIVSQPDIA